MSIQRSRYVNVPSPLTSPVFAAPTPSLLTPVSAETNIDEAFQPADTDTGAYDFFDEELAELRSALPSQVASELDDNYFKSTSKQTFLSAVKRASVVYHNDFLKFRQLEGTRNNAFSLSSPSDESRFSSIAVSSSSRDSVIAKANKVGFGIGYLRQSAIRRRALHRVVEGVVEVKLSKSLARFLPWHGTLEKIISYFGRAAASYFRLIRLLFLLNICMTFIIFFLLVLPYLFLSDAPNVPFMDVDACIHKMKPLDRVLCNDTYFSLYQQCSHDFRHVLAESLKNSTWVSHGTNVFRGQGYLTLSPLYYAYYTDILIRNEEIFAGGLLYFCVIALALFVSFVVLLVVSYMAVVENGPNKSEDFHYHFSSVAFAGWDHITASKFACDMRQATLGRFLKMELERVLRKQETEMLSGVAMIRLWGFRSLFMLISIAVIVGGIVVILITASCSQIELEATGDDAENWFVALMADFLPSIVIVLLNTFQPDIFVFLAKFENYTPETEVKLILLRLIVSRFATVVTFMVPLLGFQLKDACPVKSSKVVRPHNLTIQGDDFTCAVLKLEQTMGQKSYCWEANIGEQLYKIIVIDLITTIILTFAYSLVRRLLVEKLNYSILKKIGRREFELPVEVINLFYIQTITWMGMYFMPLLPMFAALTRLALFYMKRYDLFENTFLTWRVRAADFVQSFYMGYLCGCFIVALAFTGYTASVIMASPGCGPFAMANNNSALHAVFEEIRAMSSSVGQAADTLGHPLVSGSFVSVICFVAICCHLYSVSTKRRVQAIRHLILAERGIRDYYFSQISSTHGSMPSSTATNSRVMSSLQNLELAPPPPGNNNPTRGRRYLVNLPSSYGPDLAFGSGIYDLRRQLSRF